MLSARVPLPALAVWCRNLHHSLDIGLSAVRAFRQLAKSGPAAPRPLADRLAERLKTGTSLADALKPDRGKFPTLFLELVTVGEQTGRLTETFLELTGYFESQVSARKQFLSSLVWPGMMYCSAVLVVTLMQFILHALGGAFDPLGLGKLGAFGAAVPLLAGGGFGGAVAFLYFAGRDNDEFKQKVEAVGLTMPGVGPCYRAFALQRFCVAMHMTQEAGMRADRSVALAFRATANGRYVARAEATSKLVRTGKGIMKALATCGPTLFPDEFLDAVGIGETSGRLAEVMGQQAEHYREEALRKTKVLTMIAGAAVYAMVGLLVLAVIVRMVMGIAGVYQDAMQGL